MQHGGHIAGGSGHHALPPLPPPVRARRKGRYPLVQVLSPHTSISRAASPPAGVDALFLQSWMGLDAESAAKVAADGEAALAARRELLNSARNLGEQVGPGSG